MNQGKPVYKRILLKLSGEALARGGKPGEILNYDFVSQICDVIKECTDMGVQVGIVVGGGNIWRGRQGGKMDRTRADHMGMLATVINSLALQDSLESLGVGTRVMTAIEMKECAEPYIRNKAVSHLDKGLVVIFGCGIGSPFFSTDTAAVLRAAEIGADIVLFACGIRSPCFSTDTTVVLRGIELECDAILMAKNIDGVYTADPRVDPTATMIRDITYAEASARGLKVMDAAAFTILSDNNVPQVRVFGLEPAENIIKVLEGDMMGTVLHP